MPVITKITPQKRRRGRYNIYLDGKYSFPVSENVLADFGLRKDTKLSDERIREIVDEENFQKFYLKILDFLSYQSRSRNEIVKRLKEYLRKSELDEEFSLGVEERILDKLEEANLINDEEFVRTYINNISTSKNPPGPRKVREFLFKKGIDRDLIERHVSNYPKERETEGAKKALERKLRNAKSRDLMDPKKKQRMIQYLLRKGYSYDVVRSVVDSNFEV